MEHSRIRLAVLDIDGTLTEAHGDPRLSACGIALVRTLEGSGIPVALITGNSLPVAAGLAVYLGSTGPVAAENGCIVFYRERVIHVCKGKPPEDLVDIIARMGFKRSWQNGFRFHEAALIPGERDPGLVARARREAESRGYTAIWSGYALHIQPPGGGKLSGLKKILEVVGAGYDEVLVVGDGDNDVEMLASARYSGCPGDASEKAKMAARFVAKSRGARGTAEVVSHYTGLEVRC